MSAATRPQRSEARIVGSDQKKPFERRSTAVNSGRIFILRLAVVPVTVPPLRVRREDIPALVDHFLAVAKKRDPRAADITIGAETRSALSAHDWPGNVRELRNVLDRALYVATASGEHDLRLVDLPLAASAVRAVPAF